MGKKDFGEAFKAACEFGFNIPKPKRGLAKFSFQVRLAMSAAVHKLGDMCSNICTSIDPSSGTGSSGPKKVGKPYKMAEVAKHNTKGDCWVVINGQVCDVTVFKDSKHPGGTAVIEGKAGTDASADWNAIHAPDAIEKMAPDVIIGYIE